MERPRVRKLRTSNLGSVAWALRVSRLVAYQTQRQLAVATGMSVWRLQRIERGVLRATDADIRRLSYVLGWDRSAPAVRALVLPLGEFNGEPPT
jgi:hypothetical protein